MLKVYKEKLPIKNNVGTYYSNPVNILNIENVFVNQKNH